MQSKNPEREEMSILRIILLMTGIAILTGLGGAALAIALKLEGTPLWLSVLTGAIAGGACAILFARRRSKASLDNHG